MATTLNMTLLLRRDDFTAEAKKGYVLLAGEPGYCTATKTFKVGDGSTTWENLGFANKAQIEALIKVVDDKVAALNDTYATDEEVRVIKESLEDSIKAINDELDTYGDIVTHNAAEFDAAGAAAAVAGDLAAYETTNNARVKAIEDEIDAFNYADATETATALNDRYTKSEADAKFETITNVDKVKERVKTLEDEHATYGDIVTHNAAEFEANGAAAAAEGRINETLKNYYTKGEADTEFATPAEVIETVNKALADVSGTDTINNITTLVEYVNTNAADLTGIITEVYGAAEMTGDSRLDIIEGKAAMSIGDGDIANWNAELGAKALAQGVKDIVDANKATWDKADTALQSADLNGYALETYVDQAEADAVAEAARDAATKYETIGTAQGIVDGLKLPETYEPIGAEGRAKAYTDQELADFNTETVAPIEARVKAIEDAPYTTKKYVDDQDAATLQAAKDYADGLDHEDTTYTVAPTTNALEFTVTPAGKGEAQTVKLVAPDTGVMSVVQGTSNDVITVSTTDGAVTVAHKDYETGTIKDAAHDSATDPSFLTGVTIENGHVTGATVRNLAEVLEAMEFILDCGTATINV